MESNQKKNIESNRQEYGDTYDTLPFIGIRQARRFESNGSLKDHWELSNAQTKLYFHDTLCRHIDSTITSLFEMLFEKYDSIQKNGYTLKKRASCLKRN